ncbi:hypothetical protein AV530_002497 [Patagioenas fasciata monilis]|uniref:Uncharacterized protein n=1 Tax=Patagioenas fasciata monilis TaxID=372326 RepID=A0A1V4K6V1_PATFA|nr:hypothetical protein AV530_002497 [Patagioenas fasciata monilis]
MVVAMDLEVEVGAMVVEDSKNATRKRATVLSRRESEELSGKLQLKVSDWVQNCRVSETNKTEMINAMKYEH